MFLGLCRRWVLLVLLSNQVPELYGPKIFEPVIGALTAGRRCELEFKRNQRKAFSFSTANWEPQYLPIILGRALVCEVVQMVALNPSSGGSSGVC